MELLECRMPLPKALILDIDGVLIRNKPLLNHVKDNCVRYVKMHFPCCKDPEKTNEALYMTSGHTAVGLNKVFNIDTSDFNRKVYDKYLIEHLGEVIYSVEFQSEAKKIHDLTHKGWELTLFTNAPYEWAQPVALAIGDTVNIKCPGEYKPSKAAYDSFPKKQFKVFVDDSIKNLSPLRFSKHWDPIHFNHENKIEDWCHSVYSVEDLCKYINKVDSNFSKFVK